MQFHRLQSHLISLQGPRAYNDLLKVLKRNLSLFKNKKLISFTPALRTATTANKANKQKNTETHNVTFVFNFSQQRIKYMAAHVWESNIEK